MSVGAAGWLVEVEPALLEEAVLQAAAARPADEARAFRAERDRLYGIGEAEPRDEAFRGLSARWAARWGLTAPLQQALAGLPHRPAPRPRCLVLAARSGRDEGADLHAGQAGPVVVVRLRPATLADPLRLGAVLPRELLHVADLLDPAFAFDPASSGALGRHPASRERYRLLWRATVDGRLALGEPAAERRRQEFVRALAGAVDDPEGLFDRLMRGPRPTHAELLRLATGAAPRPALQSAPLPARQPALPS